MERDLIEAELTRASEQVRGRHILGIQDTTELNFQSHAGRTKGLGTVGNGSDAGIFLHPLLAVDAATGAGLGFGAIHIWNRLKEEKASHWSLPIEEKESYRWILSAETAKKTFSKAALVTIIGDRESDIYEFFSRVPDDRTHIINRVKSNRKLADGTKLFNYLERLSVAGEMEVKLTREIRIGRKARTALCAIRYGELTLKKPASCQDEKILNELTLRVVDIREIGCPSGEEPIHWRLLTTHSISSIEDAKQMIHWYRERWNIEQVFRTMKKQGFDIESTQVEKADSLAKLSILTLCAALKVKQLVLAREGKTQQALEDVFCEEEKKVLKGILKQVEGKTEKQKNPFSIKQLAWGAWIIARLGGWKGYKSEPPPGPITMARGLEKFKSIVYGWNLSKDLCIG